jgi:hypothetical protein
MSDISRINAKSVKSIGLYLDYDKEVSCFGKVVAATSDELNKVDFDMTSHGLDLKM